MSKKFDNRILLIVLVLLVAVFLVSRFLKTEKTEKSFKTELFTLDTANVTTILIYPKAENLEEIRFLRDGVTWIVEKGEITSDAGENSVKSLLNQLMDVKPKRLAARSKDKWEEYQLTDSLATRIKVIEEEDKEVLDLMIGKFTYQQSPNPYGGRGNIEGTTYVRLWDEEEVYAVDGFLSMSINQEFNTWRNQKVINTRKEDVTKLIFSYPADSGFIAFKKDTVWMINESPVDSLSMDQFLSSLSYMNHSDFADDFKPTLNPDFQMTVEGNNFSPVSIQAFMLQEDQYIINSSLNPKSYFRSDSEGLFSKLFKPVSYFLRSSEGVPSGESSGQ